MSDATPEQVAAVRRFNRHYTRVLGLLNEGLLASPFSLPEMRVLYELAQTERATARRLSSELGIDPGYLSRMLKRFREQGLVAASPSADDGRLHDLTLTSEGAAAFARLDAASAAEIAGLIGPLGARERQRLLAAMATIEHLIGREATDTSAPAYNVRTHRPGDLGWVVSRHGELYAEEYGWDATFEAMVADIAAGFIRAFDPERERGWIAEIAGQRVGSVLCVRQDDAVAKLRLLIVEPGARGLGLGDRLVGECIAFARSSGYRTLTLWTNDILVAARRIYERHGFRLVAEERHVSFGQSLVGQNWDLALQ